MSPKEKNFTHALVDEDLRAKIVLYGYSGISAMKALGLTPLEAVAVLQFKLDLIMRRCIQEGTSPQAVHSAKLAGEVLAEVENTKLNSMDPEVN